MPNLNTENFKLPSAFGFSGSNVKQLASAGASNQTLVTLAVDRSGSVAPYWGAICSAVAMVVKACALSPRADNLMLRVVVFNGKLTEVHGFKPLGECNQADYDVGVLPGATGSTALFDTTLNSLDATIAYAKQLDGQDISVNAIVIVITDGDDQGSSVTANTVGDSVKTALTSEALESLVTILVGVNASAGLQGYLKEFKDKAGLSQFVSIDDATDRKIAKLADFVSKSISAQSQAIGSGGPSQAVSLVI